MAAILACGPGAYVASLNAAVQMRFWRRRVTGIHLLAPREHKLAGVRVRTYAVSIRGTLRAAMTRANGRHNLHVLNRALELNAAGSAGTRSELEDGFLARASKSGLPEPLATTRIEDLEVDFHWPQLNLVVEVDGPGHTRPRTQHQDAQRDARLRAAGHTVLRVADHAVQIALPAATSSRDIDQEDT